MGLKHHHLIVQAKVGNEEIEQDSEVLLRKFLVDLVGLLDMEVLIEPQLKFSHQKAWTGLIGIVTSHISFHFWTVEKLLQLDIYSCKEFDKEKALRFIKDFWKTSDEKILFIDRESGKEFEIKKL